MGTAPGMWMKKENTVYISLPGVPYEMKYLVENEILPKIVFEYKRPNILHKTLLTYGQGESLIAEKIEKWEDNLPSFIKLAYLPSPGKVRLRLTARGENLEVLEKAIEVNVASLTELLADILVGFDDNETIEVVVGRLLAQFGKTIATAESCTGGKIAQMITSVAGASNYFKGSIICYNKEIKSKILGLNIELLETKDVVSPEVAESMVLKIRKLFQTDYAIATTGNAGPTQEEGKAGVGIVYIAIASPNGVDVQEFNFRQPREKVIERAANKALEMLQKEILKNLQ